MPPSVRPGPRSNRPSHYVDCGATPTGPVADDAYVTLTVTVTLQPTSGGHTALATEIAATTRARASATGTLHCTTRGRLERLGLETTQAKLER